MAVNDPTTNYGWDLPVDGGSTNTWGTLLNEMVAEAIGAVIESMDTVIKAVDDDIATQTARLRDFEDRVDALTNTPAYARIYRAAAGVQSILELTPTTLEWDTEVHDVGGLYNFATEPDGFVIPVGLDGLYRIRAVVQYRALSQSDNGREVKLRIKKNGSIIAESEFPWTDDGHSSISGNRSVGVVTLDEADVFDTYTVELEHEDIDSNVVLETNDGASDSWFEVVRLPSVPNVVSFAQSTAFNGRHAAAGVPYIGPRGGVGDRTFADGDMLVVAFVAPDTMGVDRLSVVTGGASAGTGNLRFVIYDSDDESSYPNQKLYESGNFSVAGANSVSTATSVGVTFIAGRVYWVGIITDTTVSPTFKSLFGTEHPLGIRGIPISTDGSWALGNDVNPSYLVTGQSFPAPDTFPGGGTGTALLKIGVDRL